MRVKVEDFTIKSLIGKGYFGEVYLAIENVTRDVYAVKKIPKTTFAQSKEERNVMAINRSEWIPTLQYAFQVNSNTCALNRQQHTAYRMSVELWIFFTNPRICKKPQ